MDKILQMRPVDDDFSNVRSLQSRLSVQRAGPSSASRMRQKRLSFTTKAPGGGPSFMTVIEATETRPVTDEAQQRHL